MRLKPSFPRLRQDHPLASGLVGAWLMGEGGGGVLRGQSTFQNDGTFNGAVAWANGPTGPALDFSTSSAYVAGFSRLIADTHNSSFSISAWVNRRDSTTGTFSDTIVSTRNGDAVNGIYFLLNNASAGELSLHFIGQGALGTAGGVVPLNEWSHVATTFNRVGNACVLYVNGIEAASGAITPSNIAAPASAFQIGSTQAVAKRQFNGLISTVLSHHRVLSPQEIGEMYADPFAMFRPRQRSYFALTGEAGTPVATPESIQLATEISSPAVTVKYATATESIQLATELSAPASSISGAVTPEPIQSRLQLSDPAVSVNYATAPDSIQALLGLSSSGIVVAYAASPESIQLATQVASPLASITGQITPENIQTTLGLSAPAITFHIASSPESIQSTIQVSATAIAFALNDPTPESLQIVTSLSDTSVTFTPPPSVGGKFLVLRVS